MINTFYYLFKVVLCSGILYSYYWLVLRDKQFHQYNRFYLLGISLFSWIIPLIKIDISKEKVLVKPVVMEIVNVMADNNTHMEHMVFTKSSQFTWDNFLFIAFISISVFFFMRFIWSLWKINRLKNKYPFKASEEFCLVMTDVEGTPFSFFKIIFWNNAIELTNEVGKKILAHEMVHVKENHSYDKLIIELQLIVGWMNPVLWLVRKELYLIHEFIADQKSIENNDPGILAELLLTSAYPKQQHLLSNSFFFSPIKRRLKMFTQSSTPKFSYLRRVSILPILCLLILLFAFRQSNSISSNTILKLKNQYTVVIDAGHGGDDSGGKGVDGTLEKEMTLLIAQKINEINSNPNIKILLTRESDRTVSVKDRVNFANEVRADLFISIHMDNDLAGKSNGVKYIISKTTNPNFIESWGLATQLERNVSSVFSKTNGVKTRERKIWVLEESQVPAVIFECGFISNAKDLAVVKSNQNEIAMKILDGVSSYLSRKNK